MTYAELYGAVCAQLEASGCDNPSFDTVCLLTDIGDIPPRGLPREDTRPVSTENAERVLAAAARRANGRPLQYILGHWDFLSLTLDVGEGVLIPRPDTERLCEVAADFLQKHAEETPRLLDLCAGSGCVGLGIASLCRRPIHVTAVELSPAANVYLQRNIARYPQYAVKAVTADVLRDAAQFDSSYHAIVSNPPYIPTKDLPDLMREVQHEPMMALDGDADGLKFYRAIAADWVPKLLPGGLCAVEVGIGQAETVAALFVDAGLHRVDIVKDYAGISRVVTGER